MTINDLMTKEAVRWINTSGKVFRDTAKLTGKGIKSQGGALGRFLNRRLSRRSIPLTKAPNVATPTKAPNVAAEKITNIVDDVYDASGFNPKLNRVSGLDIGLKGLLKPDLESILDTLNAGKRGRNIPSNVKFRQSTSLFPNFLGNPNNTIKSIRDSTRELTNLIADREKVADAIAKGKKSVKGLSTPGSHTADIAKHDELTQAIMNLNGSIVRGKQLAALQTHGKAPTLAAGGFGAYQLLKDPNAKAYNPYGYNELDRRYR